MSDIIVGDDLHCYVFLEKKWTSAPSGRRSTYWQANWEMVYEVHPVVSEVQISSTGGTWYIIKHGIFTFNGRDENGRIICATDGYIAIFERV